MPAYKFFRLNKDLGKAIVAAKDILMYKSRRGKIQAKLAVKRGNIKYETSLIYLRKEAPEKAEQFKRELLQKFPDRKFDEITLLITDLERLRVTCCNCNKEMRSDDLARHLKTCVVSVSRCTVCWKTIRGDLEEHIEQCNVRTYPCLVCGEAFNTGSKRAAHQKKCAVADENTVPPAITEGGETTAIGGRFRTIDIEPSSKSHDYEGVLQLETFRISEILKRRLESGLKFYL